MAAQSAVLACAVALAFTPAATLRQHKTEQVDYPRGCGFTAVYREDACHHQTIATRIARYSKHYKTRRGLLNLDKMMQDSWIMLRKDKDLRLDFFESFKDMKGMQAADIIATKETWTSSDTDLLLEYVRGEKVVYENGTEIELNDRTIRDALPSLDDLYSQISGKTLALVGNGRSLGKKNYGSEIDSHDVVVRFQDNIGASLNASSTGLKHNMHVVHAKRGGREDMPVFDLDTDNIVRPWCEHMFHGGKYLKHRKNVWLLSPTGFCRLPKMANDFSKTFLFYWFFGSLYDSVSLYGVMDKGTAYRYNHERFTPGEQAIWKAVAAQWVTNGTELARLDQKPGLVLRY